MPINSPQIALLHQKIKANESIDDVLAEIDPDDLLATLDCTLPYITRDLSNSDGLSAVHVAAKYGNLPALKSLSRAGANFQLTTDNYGRNPLHFAAGYNHPHIVDYLVEEMKIPVDIPTVATGYYQGYNTSPLFDCAVHSCFEAAERLIAHGAKVNYEDLDGKNPLSYAKNYGHGWNRKEVVARMDHLLLQHGAVDKSLALIPKFEEYVNTADSRKKPFIYLLNSLKNREINDKALEAIPIIEAYINDVGECNKYKSGFKAILESLKKGVYDDQSFNEIPLLEEFLKSEDIYHKIFISVLESLNKRALEVATYSQKPALINTPVVADKPQPAACSTSSPPPPVKKDDDIPPAINIIPALTTNGLFASKPEVRKKVIPESFFCTLTLECMDDPVSFGEHTFERSAIEPWLEKNRCCPICREPMPVDKSVNEVLVRNLNLKAVIEEYKQLNPELFENNSKINEVKFA